MARTCDQAGAESDWRMHAAGPMNDSRMHTVQQREVTGGSTMLEKGVIVSGSLQDTVVLVVHCQIKE